MGEQGKEDKGSEAQALSRVETRGGPPEAPGGEQQHGPSGISARVWTISNPGVGEGKRCSSVRLNMAGAADWADSGSVVI